MQFFSKAILFILTIVAVTGVPGGPGPLLPTCYHFSSPSFVDLSSHFWEFSLNASTSISSYALHVDPTVASLDAGFLTSWTLYGSNGSNGTAPTSPTDPTWAYVDSQSNVDFSIPQQGLPFRPDVFHYLLPAPVTYQYYGFVANLTAPVNATVSFVDAVTQVAFCSVFPYLK